MSVSIKSTFRRASKSGTVAAWGLAGLCATGAVAGSVWLRHKAAAKPEQANLVYSAKGFGGYVPSKKATPVAAVTSLEGDPVFPALQAYKQGHYTKAEELAEAVIRQYQGMKELKQQRYTALAQWIDAYSAARRKNFSLARERFAYLRDTARQLPDKGRWPIIPGEVPATLEEEGAFQRAVCTSALGDASGAEAEYNAFLKNYPKSVLIHAAIKRIAHLHQEQTPQASEALWKQAMQVQKKADQKARRDASLCGPQCLAELLQRRGQHFEVETLAKEMQTDEAGTRVDALLRSAQKHGFAAQGYKMTQAGLKKQTLPAIALIQPGHYVLVEAVQPDGVQIWDPSIEQEDKKRTILLEVWKHLWNGITLTLR